MQRTRFQEIACHLTGAASGLPLEFTGKTSAGPTRVGVSLVETDVAHRLICHDGLHALHRVVMPAAVTLLPIEWRAPSIRAHNVPTIGEPESWRGISAVLHELEVLAVRHQS